ncbi:MAG: hypothetical protein MHPSP_004303, partial [Paramarteilia canceri]
TPKRNLVEKYNDNIKLAEKLGEKAKIYLQDPNKCYQARNSLENQKKELEKACRILRSNQTNPTLESNDITIDGNNEKLAKLQIEIAEINKLIEKLSVKIDNLSSSII